MAAHESFRGSSKGEHLGAVTDQMGLSSAGVGCEQRLDGPSVGAAQDRAGMVESFRPGGPVWVADEMHAGADGVQPDVGLRGDGRPEPPGAGQT